MTNDATTDSAVDVRSELFERFIEVGREMRHFLEQNVASLGLTPPQAHALHLFSRPQPMGSAAEAMRCDASYITHIADDLESKGLAERTADPNDRRVKRVTLTKKGRELHEHLQKVFYDGNPLAVRLDDQQQSELLNLLRHLASD